MIPFPLIVESLFEQAINLGFIAEIQESEELNSYDFMEEEENDPEI